MSRRPRRPLACAGSLLALAALIGGCTVSTSSPRDEKRSDLYHTVLAEDRLELDLSDGLSRDEAGIAEGDATVSFSHPGGRRLIDTRLVLSPDTILEREVGLVAISGDSVTDRQATPSTVELVRRVDGVDAAVTELRRAVDELGVDRAEVDTWAEDAAEAVRTGDPVSFQRQVFRAPDAGRVGVEVEAALYVDEDQVSVRHILTLPT